MSKWTIVMIVAVTAVLTMLTGNIARFIGKSHGAASMTAKSTELSESECVERYAVTAAAAFGVRAARFMCAEIHNPATTTERQKVIGCVLPLLADARNDLAVKMAISNCTGKFMPSSAGHEANPYRNPYSD